MQSVPEHIFLHLRATPARHSIVMKFNPCHHAIGTQVSHQRMVFQRPDCIDEICRHICSPVKQSFFLINFLCGNACCACSGVGRVGIAMKKLNSIFWRRICNCVIDFIFHGNCTHRNCPVGQSFSHRNDIGCDTIALRSKGFARAAKTGNHFVKYQQDTMFIADFAQTLQIALWWD